MKKIALFLLLAALASGQELKEDTCLLVAAECISKGRGNFYLYYKISEEKIRIAKGDRLEYDVFIHSTSPELKGGIDFQLASGGSLRDSNAVDQDGLRAHGDSILEKAGGRWHRRIIDLSPLAGYTTDRWDVHFEGDAAGVYVQFIDNVGVVRAEGERIAIYENGRPASHGIDWKEGYSKGAAASVAPRAKVEAGPDLKKLVDGELRRLQLRALAAEHRQEWDLVAEALKREKRDDLLGPIDKALAAIPDPETFDGSAEDFLAILHKAEHELSHSHPLMQKYTGHLVGHAHIDFQWLWEWPETIQICKDTFGQAVKFMEEYPDFTFSQSSAALYLATEQHHPELFEKIRRFVKKGQWEIVGGRWCEGDTNMISGESHARHFLYGQRYFREKFGATARVGWEPDTFGHCWTMPQILRRGGCETYYFCRAGKGKALFWWEAPDGSRVMAFEEPAIKGGWYNSDVTLRQIQELFEFHAITGSRDMLWVYGVGNHGGGPTLENLKTALGWKDKKHLPQVKFSTATAFFDALKKNDLRELPVVRDELNTVFEGSYTTHGDMKRWNRDVESLTVAAETAAALAARHGYAYPRAELLDTWRDALWNHHHDTLPGTSIHASYKLSRTMYERGLASSRKILEDATRVLADRVKEAKAGDLFVLNTLGWTRDAVVVVKPRPDLPEDPIAAVSPAGEPRPIQRTPEGDLIFVAKDLPPFGYRLYRIEKAGPGKALKVDGSSIQTPRFDLTVDPATGAVTKLFDRNLRCDVLRGPAGDLEVWWERPRGMSAWVIGELVEPDKPSRSEKLEVVEAGPVRVRLRVKRVYDKSSIAQDVIVYRDLDVIEFALDVDWQQKGTRQKGGPFLKARFALDVDQARARFAIPFGDIERPMDGDEVPALQWADVANNEWGAAVLNDCKSGYSAKDGTLRLSLIRSSCEPDPEPDLGRHFIRFALYPHAGSIHEGQVPKRGFEFGTAPVPAWIGDARGVLPREKSFLSVEGALPTALKLAEEGDAWIVRFYESTGAKSTATIRGAGPVSEVDFVEDPVGNLGASSIPMRGYEIKTVKLGK
jgi:alpha-mannosidase